MIPKPRKPPTAPLAPSTWPLAASTTAKVLWGATTRRIQPKHGLQLAIKATAHKLARIVYTMIKTHTEYHDLGELYYEERYHERTLRRLQRKATELGFQLVPVTS